MDAKTTSHEAPSWLGRTLLAVGISGAAFAALCCVAPFLVAGLVTALGLGFILNDALLIGLLVVFSGVHRSGRVGLLLRAPPDMCVT